jgi:threonine/homoserine/homoserine lactone efflux protein
VETVLEVLFYALVAAASPLALTSTLVVLRSRRGRLNGFIFAAAFLLGGGVVWLVLLSLGTVTSLNERDRHGAAIFELVLGVLLLVVAWFTHRGFPAQRGAGGGRTRALLDRLERLTPVAAFPAGAVLGIGGPKRLAIAIVATTTVSVAGLTTEQQIGLAVLFVLVAGVLVWVPVAFYLVASQRATAWLEEAQDWLRSNRGAITIYSLLVLGGALVAEALAELL